MWRVVIYCYFCCMYKYRGGESGVECWTSRWPPVWEIASRLAVAGDVFDSVFLCCPFSNKMSCVRSGTWLSQFLRMFLPTLSLVVRLYWTKTAFQYKEHFIIILIKMKFFETVVQQQSYPSIQPSMLDIFTNFITYLLLICIRYIRYY